MVHVGIDPRVTNTEIEKCRTAEKKNELGVWLHITLIQLEIVVVLDSYFDLFCPLKETS